MTIYDIAKLAGVSASSVSRVVNNKPGVNPETRKKILRLLESYNYTPNAIARGLVSQSSKTVGVLVADIRDIHHTDGAYHIERELSGAGYVTLIINTGHRDEEKVSAISLLSRRRVEGVVLMGSIFQCDAVKEAIRQHLSDIPVVIVNGWLDLPNVYGVITDEKAGVMTCVDHLTGTGRKKIAFVHDVPYNPSNTLKKAGYFESAAKLGLDPQAWSYEAPHTLEGGVEATRKLLAEHPDTDGIVYAIDLLAAGGLQELHAQGIAVPERIAITGINNSTYAMICSPQITSLDNKRKDASIFAARIIVDHLTGRRNPNRVILIPELIRRQSS